MQQRNRIALSPSTTGRIMFVNLYSDELLFAVNGKPYRVPAGRTVAIDNQPAGTFTYEVISSVHGPLRRTTTVLSPSETVTISAVQ